MRYSSPIYLVIADLSEYHITKAKDKIPFLQVLISILSVIVTALANSPTACGERDSSLMVNGSGNLYFF